MKTKICPICNKEFVDPTKSHNKKFCSKKCYEKNRSIVGFRKRGNFRTKNCAQCGKSFEDISRNGKIICCSKICMSIYKKEQRKSYGARISKYNKESGRERRTKFKEEGICLDCGRKKFGKRGNVCKKHWLQDRARKALGSTKYWKDLENLFNQQKGLCYYTGLPITLEETASVDHKKSKANGGNNKIENIVWCRLDINIMKWKKNDKEFIDLCKIIAKRFQSVC